MYWPSTSYTPWIISVLLLSLPQGASDFLSRVSSSFLSWCIGTKNPKDGPTTNPHLQVWSQNQQQEIKSIISQAETSAFAYLVVPVLFQAQTSWSNTLWINAGAETKAPFCISKNCPVLSGDTVVGIVDFVANHSCRVRLLSDPTVHPAVRVVRTNSTNRRSFRAANELLNTLKKAPESSRPELLPTLTRLLTHFIQSLPPPSEIRLAKGELQGANHPSQPTLWRGVGFNFDTGDDESSKRDLRTGQRDVQDAKIPLIQPGDLLETSGLDGCFPRGLPVATVTEVFPLEEGAAAYQILAKTEAVEFPYFDFLTIIPAQPQEPLSPPDITDLIQKLIEEEKIP